MEIKHKNILYVATICPIGGVETFLYQMIKKYHNLDIGVVYREANKEQLKRIRKYCPTYKIQQNDIINCEVAIINYDVTIIDQICKEAKIYQTIHVDYKNTRVFSDPPHHDRIYKYIGVTKYIRDTYKKLINADNIEYSYNPLEIEKAEKPLILVSPTRLTQEKGKTRIETLGRVLNELKIDYIWYIITDDTEAINNPNIVYIKPRLDVSYFIEQADYLVQLSDTEALSYSINEALYRNIPIIVTPLPYLEEIGVKDGVNAYIMDFNCDNVYEVANKLKNKPKFIFKRLEDKYKDILIESESHYEGGEKMYKVRATDKYKINDIIDTELGCVPEPGKEWEVDEDRKNLLLENGYIEVIGETKVIEVKPAKKTRKK